MQCFVLGEFELCVFRVETVLSPTPRNVNYISMGFSQILLLPNSLVPKRSLSPVCLRCMCMCVYVCACVRACVRACILVLVPRSYEILMSADVIVNIWPIGVKIRLAKSNRALNKH